MQRDYFFLCLFANTCGKKRAFGDKINGFDVVSAGLISVDDGSPKT